MINFRKIRKRHNRRVAYKKQRKVFLSNVIGRLRRSGRYSRHYLKDLEKGLERSGYYEHVMGNSIAPNYEFNDKK